jgi:hypothetical protein
MGLAMHRGLRLATLLATWLAAECAHADSVSTASAGGYGRMIFTLDPPSRAEASISGGVLAVHFDRAVSLDPASVAQGLGGYVAGARGDANGRDFRFALSQTLRVHVSSSANRVAVDLVPESFAGTPPDLPLPRKPVEAVDVAALPVLTVRAGLHASYSRIVFDWPKHVAYAVFPGAGRFSVRFEAMARPELSALAAVAPPWVKNSGWRIEGAGTVIDFTLDPQSRIRDSRDGNKIVLDIAAPKGDAGAQATTSQRQETAIVQMAAKLAPPVPAPIRPTPPAPQTSTQTPPAIASTGAVDAVRDANGVTLQFPGAAQARFAAFIRGQTAWVVIDNSVHLDFSRLASGLGDFVSKVDVSSADGFDIVRMGLKNGQTIAAHADGSALFVSIGADAGEPVAAIDLLRTTDSMGHSSLAAVVPGAQRVLTRSDPSAGDSLVIVPALAGHALPGAHRYAEFALLPSAAGLVIQPYTEDLQVDAGAGRAMVSRPGGLALSETAPTTHSDAGLREARADPSFLDLSAWEGNGRIRYLDRERQLRRAVASVGDDHATESRRALAQFYLAEGFGAEAQGVIAVMLRDDPTLQGDAQVQTMRAAAAYMMGRYKEAMSVLAGAAVDRSRHASVWRGLSAAAMTDWATADSALRFADPVIADYPAPWQARIRLAQARTFNAHGNRYAAETALKALPANLPSALALEGTLVRAELFAAEGQSAAARTLFAGVEAGPNERLAAEAISADVADGLAAGKLKPAVAIDRLESLRFRWRGDALELQTLLKLSDLYLSEHRWRDGLKNLERASRYFPNADEGRKAQDRMRTLFAQLFLQGGADHWPALAALSLFYDFVELTPIGPDGDEMIRRMTDRLVASDLLGPAEKLLRYQVDKRLDGPAQSQVAARLAMIELMDRKPKDALATLRATKMSGLPDDVLHQRTLLEARALASLKQWDDALALVAADNAPDTDKLRADIYWESANWPLAGRSAEAAVTAEAHNATPLSDDARQTVMRAAVAYSLAGDEPALTRLRDAFGPRMKASPDNTAFAVVTGPIDLQNVAFRDQAAKIAAIDTLESFMKDLRKGPVKTD